MSDLFKTREKVEKGAEWRGNITISIDDEQQNLCVRQLRDTEFWEVMSLVDTDELEELQDSLPEEKMEDFRELRDSEELTDEEQSRLDSLQDELEDGEVNMFEIISSDTFKGIQKAAKYGVEPDNDDKREALIEFGDKIEEQYGRTTQEEAAKYINNQVIHPMIDRATGFASFSIGIKCLTESIGDTGNLEN
ncbi:hypothetical protein [Natrinema sp. DC36]|uniref:hypothetical protein n=1 Tax=Natrinema sp. DC36 TaxID=2878680 RepID=UPI001CF0D3B0|nr:hypothetical protein [Natrinema sp. DC36]